MLYIPRLPGRCTLAVVRWLLPNQTSGGLILWQNNLGIWWWWAFDAGNSPNIIMIVFFCTLSRLLLSSVADSCSAHCRRERWIQVPLLYLDHDKEGERDIAKFPLKILFARNQVCSFNNTGSPSAWERSRGELRRSRSTTRLQSILP